MHVAQHEGIGKGIPLERNAEGMAHEAVRTVASHHEAGMGEILPPVRADEVEPHLLPRLREAVHRDAPLHFNAEAREMLGEDALSHRLRDAESAIGQIGQVRGDGPRRRPVHRQTEPVEPESGIDHGADDAHVLIDFQGPGRDAQRAAVDGRGGSLLQNAAAHPVARQLRRQREPHRACADHDHIRRCLR